MILIGGFYRAGVQLVANGLEAAGSHTVKDMLVQEEEKWTVSLDFLGLHPKSGVLEASGLWKDSGAWKSVVFPCFYGVQYWEEWLQKASKRDKKVIIVYRPLEQVVDSITREGVKKIYARTKLFKRMYALRNFQKSLPELQYNLKSAFIEYYLSAKSFAEKNAATALILNSSSYRTDMPKIMDCLQSEYQLDLQEDRSYFEPDRFTLQKPIDSYREEALNTIQSFFGPVNEDTI